MEFSKFLISPAAENHFFAGCGFFTFADTRTEWWNKFWNLSADPLTTGGVVFAWCLAIAFSGIGLAIGNWMSNVKR